MKLVKKLADTKASKEGPEPSFLSTESEVTGIGTDGGMGLTSSFRPNIYGGRDEYRNGTLVGTSRPNIFGGFDRTTAGLHEGEGGPDVLDALIGGAYDIVHDLLANHDPHGD